MKGISDGSMFGVSACMVFDSGSGMSASMSSQRPDPARHLSSIASITYSGMIPGSAIGKQA